MSDRDTKRTPDHKALDGALRAYFRVRQAGEEERESGAEVDEEAVKAAALEAFITTFKDATLVEKWWYHDPGVSSVDRDAEVDEEARELQVVIEDSLTAIERSRRQMQSDQVEIDSLRDETRRMISRLLAA